MEDPTNPKAQEIALRRMQVERLHIWGHSVSEIAAEVRVDERTVSRDIAENRKERLKMVVGGKKHDAKNWLRNELADYIAFMDEAKRTLCENARTFTNESARVRALTAAVGIANEKVETIKSLMFSIEDLEVGSYRLDERSDDEI